MAKTDFERLLCSYIGIYKNRHDLDELHNNMDELLDRYTKRELLSVIIGLDLDWYDQENEIIGNLTQMMYDHDYSHMDN